MSTPAQYRFLPWSRRGLVAELRDSGAAATGALPARGVIKLAMTLSGGLGGADRDRHSGRPRRRGRHRDERHRPHDSPARGLERRAQLPRRRRLRRRRLPMAAHAVGRQRAGPAAPVVGAGGRRGPSGRHHLGAGGRTPAAGDHRVGRRRRAARPHRLVGVGPHATARRARVRSERGAGPPVGPRPPRLPPALPAAPASRLALARLPGSRVRRRRPPRPGAGPDRRHAGARVDRPGHDHTAALLPLVVRHRTPRATSRAWLGG